MCHFKDGVPEEAPAGPMEREETQAFRVLTLPVRIGAEFGTSEPGAGYQVQPLRKLQA